jgi:kynurenine formamidase
MTDVPQRPDALAILGALRDLTVVDLTHPLHEGMPFFPAKVPLPFERTQTAFLDRMGVNSGRFSMSEHMGTHLDSPNHFVDSDVSVELIPAEHLVAPAVVIDVRAAVDMDDDHRLTPADVAAWESTHGRVPAGNYVLMLSGWAERWGEPERYNNVGADGVLHYPACTPEAAQLLVDRAVLGVGVDTLSVDNSRVGSVKGAAHKVLHGAGRYVLENLADLDALPPTDILLVIGALPVVGGTGGPARVLAFHGAGSR